jgi:beta-lactam-binding protein with PASTA domain
MQGARTNGGDLGSVRDVATVAELLVGRYELRECVGSGGMGVVHRAHDLLLDRDVAVKVPNLAAATGSRERFRREARAAARLNHPNVVSVYDWEERDDEAFLVMEYVDGPSLRQVVRERGPLAVREAARIGEQVATALAHAHSKGIVHRDVKPGNVLLAPDGTGPERIVKVTDFGIARASESDTITDPGAVIGTAGYLAPEQIRGSRVDGRTDIYALGVLLATLTGGAPGALDPVVRRATAPEPADRYQRAADLADVLGGIARGDTLTAIPVVSPPPRVKAPRVVAPRDVAPRAVKPPRESPKRRRVWRARHVLAILVPLVLIAAAIPAYLLFFDRPPTVVVPEVVNRDVFGAAATLRDAKFVLVQRFVDSPMPGGVVLDQRPRSGEQADEGSEITLTISRVEATVPHVAGFILVEAKARLARVGFNNVVVTEEDRDDVQPGTVLRSTPEVGLRADKLAVFTLVVARDPYVKLPPDIVGKDEATVTSILQSLGLQGKRETQTSRTVPAGTVTSVSPGAGQPIRRGSFVSYKVSTGPKLVPVPQVTQRSVDDAVDDLERLGFTVAVTYVTAASNLRGKVVSQSPNGGTAAEGSTVTLNVGVNVGK